MERTAYCILCLFHAALYLCKLLAYAVALPLLTLTEKHILDQVERSNAPNVDENQKGQLSLMHKETRNEPTLVKLQHLNPCFQKCL